MCRPLVVALAALALLVSLAEAQPQIPRNAPTPIVIKELTIEGYRRVQEAVILGRVRSTVGSPFNPPQDRKSVV